MKEAERQNALFEEYLREMAEIIKQFAADKHPALISARKMHAHLKEAWKDDMSGFSHDELLQISKSTLDLIKAPLNSEDFNKSSSKYVELIDQLRIKTRNHIIYSAACILGTVIICTALTACLAISLLYGSILGIALAVPACMLLGVPTLFAGGMFGRYFAGTAQTRGEVTDNMRELDSAMHKSVSDKDTSQNKITITTN